jgi:E3 ubiquitin-protein ligase HUWE1
MTASVREQIDAFLDGFHDVVPPELISIFDAQELELLMAGLPDIDIDDMRQNCIYGGGYKQTDDTIQKFWSVLRRFNREEKAQFVQFVTGSAKVPLDGFSALRGAEGVQRMAIHKAYDASLLPTAHTCFNQLDLPEYESEDKLREMLLTALKHGSEGFGFA